MGLPKKEIKALLDMARAVLSGDDEEAIRALSLNIKAHDHCRMIRAQREEEAKRRKDGIQDCRQHGATLPPGGFCTGGAPMTTARKTNLQVIQGAEKQKGRIIQPGKDFMVKIIERAYPEAILTLEWKEQHGLRSEFGGKRYRTAQLSSPYVRGDSFQSMDDAIREVWVKLQQKTELGENLSDRLERIERELGIK